MPSNSKYFTVSKGGKRIYFNTYTDAKKWVQSQSGYPKGMYHIYPTEWEIVTKSEKKIYGKVKQK